MKITYYKCGVAPTDKIGCYVTTSERQGQPQPLFAVVATNEREDKVSVLLDYEQAQDLIDQLTDFMMKGVYD